MNPETQPKSPLPEPLLRGARASDAVLALLFATAALAAAVLAASQIDAWITRGVEFARASPGASGIRFPPAEFLAHAFAAEAGLLLVALGLALVGPAGLSLRLRREHAAPMLLALLGALALNAAGSFWMERIGESYGGLPELRSPAWTLLILVAATVAAPLVEELLFRELLLCRTLAAVPRPVALALTSLAFGALHYSAGGIVLFATVAGLGAIFGWLRLRCGSLGPPVVVHAANNLAALVLALLAERYGG